MHAGRHSQREHFFQGRNASAVARRLTQNGVTVLTSLEGRGAKSRERAQAAGMRDIGDKQLVDEARMAG